MRRLGAALLALLAGCTAEAPPAAEKVSSGDVYEWIQTRVALERLVSIAAVEWPPPQPSAYGELDVLLDGRGPQRLGAAEMDDVVRAVVVGRFRGLHGISGPGIEARYDLNGDRLSDRVIYSDSRYGKAGVLYVQAADRSFRRAGRIDLGQSFQMCPQGRGVATLQTFAIVGADPSGGGQTLRVGQARIDTLAEAGFSLYDLDGVLSEPERRTCERLGAAASVRRTGCLLMSDFERGHWISDTNDVSCIFDGDATEAPDPNERVLPVDSGMDSLRVVTPAFRDDGPFRWTLRDPAGVVRASGRIEANPRILAAGGHTVPQVERVVAARPGRWTIRHDLPADRWPGHWPSLTVYGWKAPRLIR